MLRIYQLLILILLPVVVLRLIYRSIREPAYRAHLVERFGWVGDYPAHDVWIHAVSAGETIAADALIRSLLKEGRSIVLTVTTPAGRAAAHRLFGQSITLAYAPYDVPVCVNRFLKRMAPRAALIIETEIWPGWLAALDHRGIPAALVNGRLSEKSYRRYARAKGLIQTGLQSLALVGCQSEAHRERFLALGARESSVQALGSIKFDAGLPSDFQEEVLRLKRRLGPEPALLAASTHAPEESFCLTAFKASKLRYPSLRLVLAPRHVHRAEALVNDATSAGFKAKVTSQSGPLGDVDVVVLDEMGQLLTWYGAAQVAFIGGTLIDHGGHNLVEAAAAGCPVVVGQSLYNFESMAALFLAERAMVEVQDEQALSTALGTLLGDDDERTRLRDSARRLVHRESGALDRTLAALIAANVLPGIPRGSELMKNLLILCTGNACRSQITEGYFRALRGDEFLVRSAGIEAHGLNSTAVAVMEEVGVDISDHQSEMVTDAMIQWADAVITVCGNAQEARPVLPAGVKETHWPIPDPAAIKGVDAVVLAGFRSVREDIRARVEQFELGAKTRAPNASC